MCFSSRCKFCHDREMKVKANAQTIVLHKVKKYDRNLIAGETSDETHQHGIVYSVYTGAQDHVIT